MNSDWIQDSTIVMVKYGCVLGHHCLSPCFDCHWEYSSQERPQRYGLHCHHDLCAESHPGSDILSTEIIFVFHSTAVAHFDLTVVVSMDHEL